MSTVNTKIVCCISTKVKIYVRFATKLLMQKTKYNFIKYVEKHYLGFHNTLLLCGISNVLILVELEKQAIVNGSTLVFFSVWLTTTNY